MRWSDTTNTQSTRGQTLVNHTLDDGQPSRHQTTRYPATFFLKPRSIAQQPHHTSQHISALFHPDPCVNKPSSQTQHDWQHMQQTRRQGWSCCCNACQTAHHETQPATRPISMVIITQCECLTYYASMPWSIHTADHSTSVKHAITEHSGHKHNAPAVALCVLTQRKKGQYHVATTGIQASALLRSCCTSQLWFGSSMPYAVQHQQQRIQHNWPCHCPRIPLRPLSGPCQHANVWLCCSQQ